MSLPRDPESVRRALGSGTRVAAVIGDPVAHSRSPALHNAAFAANDIDAVFLAMRVTADGLADAVRGFRSLGFLGVSVTVPHKRAVIDHCDQLSDMARTIGAVNCLAFEAEGANVRIVGHNTDAGGFIDSLHRDAAREPEGLRAVVLGAGGAARAVHAGLVAARAERVSVIARSPDRVHWLPAQPWTAAVLDDVCRDCDLLVDCTSTALHPDRELEIPCAIPVHRLPATALVASLVYHRRPALLSAAEARGLATLDGAGMLVYQGGRAFELWTGTPAPTDDMWRAMRESLVAADRV